MKSVKTTIIFILLFISAQTLFAGEGEKLHLTGNTNVDFFSLREFSSRGNPGESPMLFPEGEKAIESEKSPWLAAGLSLILPGVGEFYSGDYLRAGIFLGIEAGLWTTASIYNTKGDDQTALFERFANDHWSAVKYAFWVRDHLGELNSDVTWTNYDVFNIPEDDVDPNTPPPFVCINWEELQRLEEATGYGGGNGFTHKLPFYAQQQYYELIGKYEQFSRGWDDSDPNLDPGNTNPIKSTSRRFFDYAEMRAQANNYYDVSSAMVSIAVLNHVLSAIDAALTAGQFNRSLHAEARMRMQPSPFGSVPVKELNVSFNF